MPKSRVTFTEKYFMRQFQAGTLRGAVETAARQEMDASLFDEYYGVPVDIEQIARRKGIRISKDLNNLTCHEAKLLPDKSGFVIQLRNQSSLLRKRTTLAHEVGHTLFYQDYGDKPRHQVGILDVEELFAEERICNLFARALLMPTFRLKESVLPVAPEKPFSFMEVLDRTSRKFEVSLPALIMRLSDVKISTPPYVILCLKFSENRRTGIDAQLRVDSCTGLGSAGNLYIWRNRSAKGINLRSALKLFKAWTESIGSQQDEAGKFFWDEVNGLSQAKEGSNSFVNESVEVSIFRNGRWRTDSMLMMVSNVLYAKRDADVRDVNIISVLAPRTNNWSGRTDQVTK